jgi:hypothetical protein
VSWHSVCERSRQAPQLKRDSLGSGIMRLFLSLVPLVLSACASRSSQVTLYEGTPHLRTRPDTVVSLLIVPPTDSVLAVRGQFTVMVSAQTAVHHLQDKLTKYPHLSSDSALMRSIQEGVARAGWVQLHPRNDDARQREDFLLAALLEGGAAVVRSQAGSRLVDSLAVRPWGTCEMANGRRFLLRDSAEVLRVLDGWHMCPAA